MTTEAGMPALGTVWGHVERIRRHLGWVEQRLALDDLTQGSRDHLAQERAALLWALPVLEAEYDDLRRRWQLVASFARSKDAAQIDRMVAKNDAKHLVDAGSSHGIDNR